MNKREALEAFQLEGKVQSAMEAVTSTIHF